MKGIWEAEIRSRRERKGGGWEESRKRREGRVEGDRKKIGSRKDGKEISGREGGRISYLCPPLLLWQLIGIEWF